MMKAPTTAAKSRVVLERRGSPLQALRRISDVSPCRSMKANQCYCYPVRVQLYSPLTSTPFLMTEDFKSDYLSLGRRPRYTTPATMSPRPTTFQLSLLFNDFPGLVLRSCTLHAALFLFQCQPSSPPLHTPQRSESG